MKKKQFLLLVIILFASIAPYLPALKGEILSSWDDGINIGENYRLQAEDGLKNIWFGYSMPSYLPVTYTLFYLQYKLWGLAGNFFHLISIILHSLNGILVFLLLSKLVSGRTAFLTAIIWCIHPLRVESVAWVTEQKALLSALFSLLGIYYFIKSWGNKRVHLLLSIAFCFLAGLSKLNIVMLPLLLLGTELLKNKKISPRNIVACSILAVIYAYLVWNSSIAEANNLKPVDSLHIPYLMHFFIAVRAIWFYLVKTLFPTSLLPVYPLWATVKLGFAYILAVLAIAVISVLVFRAYFRQKEENKLILFSWIFYIISVLPVSGIVPIPYMMQSFVADRYAYFPSIFLTLFLVLAIEKSSFFRFKKEFYLMAIPFLMVLSWQQTKIWKNPKTLWEYTESIYPDCESAHTNLGTYYVDKGFLFEALQHYQKAYQLSPNTALSNYNMGVVHLQLGELKLAEEYYRKAILLLPAYPDALCNLGNTLLRQGRVEEAVSFFNKALEYPHHPKVDRAVAVNFRLIEQSK